MVLEVVNGRHVGISPTELTVSLEEEEKPKSRVNKEKGKNRRNKKIMNTDQTPRNSISTSIEKAFLNSLDCLNPHQLSSVYILYAKGTC